MKNLTFQPQIIEDYAIPYENPPKSLTEREIYIQMAFATLTVGLIWAVAYVVFSF